MSKPLKVTCPECKRKGEKLGEERMFCTGKRTPTSVPHKELKEMK